MNLSLTKKILLSVLGLGVVGSLVGLGTFASFTAQTTNPNNTFSTGTLVLDTKKTGGTTCLSTGGGATDTNLNSGCDTLISTSVSKPGDAISATITITNAGTLNASALKIFANGTGNGCVGANNTESYHGTGDPCTVVDINVQEYSDSGFTTPSACRFGGGTATTCAFGAASKTLSDFDNNTSTSPINAGAMNAGAVRYFLIGLKMPTSADNTMQGRKATMDINWLLEQ